ncbi:hypothetical protein ACQKIW_28060 [Bacillus thuringiensis]|uniref:hypothetical protein n=1 Tax=Bacillus thuringiensis TaxID=1428 RepID=UPI003D0498B8
MKEFANEIGVSKPEIHNLIKKGMVTEKLLDMICMYFQIQNTPLWMRYILTWSRKTGTLNRLRNGF